MASRIGMYSTDSGNIKFGNNDKIWFTIKQI